MKPNWINFVLVGDKNYMTQLSVTIVSIILNLSTKYIPRFFLFVSGVDAVELCRFNELNVQREYEIIPVHMENYANYFSELDSATFKLGYITIATYYRLMMLSILPDDVEKCFYIDGDMIVDCDLTSCYDELKTDRLAAVVVDVYSMQNRHVVLGHLYELEDFIPFSTDPLMTPYFNAGFFLLNIRLARELKLFDAALDFLARVPNPPYADQDTLNAIIGQDHYDKVVYLHPSYNVFCNIDYDIRYNDGYYSLEAIREGFAHPKIYHFAGGDKPWKTDKVRHHREKWLYYYEQLSSKNVIERSVMPSRDLLKLGGRCLVRLLRRPGEREVRVVGFIPLIKAIKQSSEIRFYLFNVIPIYRIVNNGVNGLHHLFNVIPFLETQTIWKECLTEQPDSLVE